MVFQAVSFLSGTDRYSLKVLCELPPQVGKPISEGAEAARKSGLISACSFRQPQDEPGPGTPISPVWLRSPDAHLESSQHSHRPSAAAVDRSQGSGKGVVPLLRAGPEPAIIPEAGLRGRARQGLQGTPQITLAF